jgi:long-chain fatty acid transport protein
VAKGRNVLLRFAAATLLFCTAQLAHATAGYFQLGYGMKAKGMAGAGIAFPQDALAPATNPAGIARLGSTLHLGVERFAAERGSEIVGNRYGLNGARDASDPPAFWVPEAGATWAASERLSLGVALFGNGGSTSYAQSPLLSLEGSEPAGMHFVQALAAPALAFRLDARNSVGVALNLVYQSFEAKGFQYFDDPLFSAHPGKVTNLGTDRSIGIGPRFGWLGELHPALALGATWQPKIRMKRFDRYEGLLAEGGNFDVPQNYGVGLAWQATPALAIAADVLRIEFAGVRSIGASSSCFMRAARCLLGADDGPGSGWRNTTVLKLGAAYRASSRLVLRAGFARLRQPIPPGETLLNMFAPAVSEKHLALGASYALARGWELSAAYTHAFPNTVYGSDSIPPGNPPGGIRGGEANIHMSSRAFGAALGTSF